MSSHKVHAGARTWGSYNMCISYFILYSFYLSHFLILISIPLIPFTLYSSYITTTCIDNFLYLLMALIMQIQANSLPSPSSHHISRRIEGIKLQIGEQVFIIQACPLHSSDPQNSAAKSEEKLNIFPFSSYRSLIFADNWDVCMPPMDTNIKDCLFLKHSACLDDSSSMHLFEIFSALFNISIF